MKYKYCITWVELLKSVHSDITHYHSWCRENLGKEFEDWEIDTHISEGIFFNNEESYVAFKLRWV